MSNENLSSPDPVAMEATQESASDWLKRVSPGVQPKQESADEWLQRVSPVTTPAPQDLQQSVLDASKTDPARAARVMTAKAQSKVLYPTDYVDRNLEKIEAENQKAGTLNSLYGTDVKPDDQKDNPKLLKFLNDDPYRMALFSEPQEMNTLFKIGNEIKKISAPDDVLAPLTPAEKLDQASRWATQRYDEYMAGPMGWLGEGTHDRATDIQELTAQGLDEIDRQEAYIADTRKDGFLDTFKRIHQENPLWWASIFNALEPIERNMNISAAKDRIKNKQGSQADMEYLERERRYAVAKLKHGEDIGGHFAEIATTLPAFMGGLGMTKTLAQGVEQGILSKGSGVLANSLANPLVSGGLIAGAKVAGVASQVGTAGLGNIVSQYYQNKGESPESEALAKAVVSEMINYGSLHLPANPVAKLMMQEGRPALNAGSVLRRLTEGGIEGAVGFLGTNEATKLASAAAGVGPAYELPTMEQAVAQLGSGALLGIGHAGIEHMTAERDLRHATAVAEGIAKASKAVEALAAQKTAPAVVQQAVAAMATDAPVTHVDPEVFQTYFQDKGIDPHKFADELTGKQDVLRDAILDNHPLQIPTDAYITKIGATEHGQYFQDKVTVDPEKPSQEEAKAHVDELGKEIEEERKAKQEAAKVKREPKQDVLDQPQMIAKNLRENLEAAGFKNSAKAISALIEPSFRKLGEHAKAAGIDVQEFFAKFTPKIETQVPTEPVEGSQYVKVLEQSGKEHIEQVKAASRYDAVEKAKSQWSDATIEPMTAEEVQHYLPIAMGKAESGVTLEQPAYHGSPYKFEKFDSSKIGTGEGAQVYGHGLYFAGNKKVSEYYRDKLSAGYRVKKGVDLSKYDEAADFTAESALNDTNGDKKAAIEQLKKRERISIIKNGIDNPKITAHLRDGIKLLESDALEKTGRLYTVDIPEDGDYLNYDKPLSEQSGKVKAGIAKLFQELMIPTGGDAGTGNGNYTGQQLYGELVRHFAQLFDNPPDNPARAASEELSKLGIPGIKYLDQSSRAKGEGTSNYVLFDDKLAKITGYEQEGNAGPRGRINIGNSSISISLLEKADHSTFVHELGHLYLEAIGDIASSDKASGMVKGDYKTLLDWMGVKDRSEIGTAQHEQFARGFERYLMEGKAPSSKLRKVFDKFREWLTSIYQNVRNLGVELTPEVRSVFDRLLASDEEIAKAKARAGLTDDFLDAPGITLGPKDHAKRMELEAARDEAARAKVDEAALADIKAQQTEQYQHARDMMEQTVTSEVNARPEQIALSLLQKGQMPDGRELPEGVAFKLDRNAIPKLFVDQYTGIDLKSLPRGITTKDGGIHPDIAAEMLGFKNGKELIQALSGLDRDKVIQQETDQRMESQVEKPIETLDQAAREAIHNDKEAELKIFGLKWLLENKLSQHTDITKAVTDPVKYLKEVRKYAQDKVDAIPASELDPRIYEAGERKARKRARNAVLEGQYGTAFKWKDKELLNHEFYRAAVEAKSEMQDKSGFKRFFDSDASMGKSRDTDLVAAGRAILAAYGYGKSDKPASEYLSKIEAYDPDTYATIKGLVDEATAGASPDPTYGQYKAVKDATDALWDLAKRSKQMEIAGKLVDREEATTAVGTRLVEMDQSHEKRGYQKAASTWEKTKMGMLGVKSAIRRVESWAEMIGPVAKKYISDPIYQATANFREAKKLNQKDYLEDVKDLDTKSFKKRPIESPELGYTFSGKGEIVSALLHTGNSSNYQKLLRGRGWGDFDAEGKLDTSKWDAFLSRMIQDGTITKADYDYAQKVWDRFDGLKVQAQKAHREMYGFYFNEVTKEPIQTPFGEYKGGYVPAMADPFMSSDAAQRNEKEALEKNSNSYMFPTTGRGFTKNRSEGYAAPLALGLEFLPAQFDKVLRFIHIEPRIKDAARLIQDKSFAKQLDAFDPTVRGDMLVPWLQRAAQQRSAEPAKGWAGKALDTFCRELRTRTGMQMMVANVSNALQQTTGLFSTKLQVSSIRDAMWEYTRHPQQLAQDIADKSVYMRNRMTPQEMELRSTMDELILDPSTYQQAKDFANRHGYFLQEGVQNIVDKVSWRAAYDEATGKGMTDPEAILHADSVIRQTQFSTNPEDISRLEAGTAFTRMFTMFMSHYNRQLNLLMTESAKAGELPTAAAARRKAYIAFTGFVMPALVANAISKALSGDLTDESDDSAMTGVMKFFFGSLFDSAVSLVPVAGPIVGSAVSKFTGSGADDKLGTSPAFSAATSSLRAPHSIFKALEGEGKAGTAVRDVLTLIGVLTKTPAGALGRPLGYAADLASGDAEAHNPLELIRGFVSGHSGKKRK